MLSYATRAVPWTRVCLAAALVVLLVELVRWDPWTLWPLQGAAVGLLAGATAWCFDETAAIVVDTSPRGLGWRTAARAPGIALLALAWTGAVLHAGDAALFGHRYAVLGQGLAAMAGGAAYAGWRRARGESSPGLVFATAVVPMATVWALVRPLREQLEVFPYGTTPPEGWTQSTVGWSVVGVVGFVVLAAALAEAPWWSVGGRRALRRT